MLILVLLTGFPAAANADGPGRCYPPPCSAQPSDGAAAGPDPAMPSPVAAGTATADDRSPAPYVGIGLSAVIGSLAAVALRRRANIVRRSHVRPARPVRTVPADARRGRPVRRSPDVARDGVTIR